MVLVMVSFEDQVQAFDIRGILITSILTAMSILVAWLWKDALADTVTRLLPTQHEFLSPYITATVGTVFVVTFAYVLLKGQQLRLQHLYTFREKVKIRAHKSERIRKIREMTKSKKMRFKYKYTPKRTSNFF